MDYKLKGYVIKGGEGSGFYADDGHAGRPGLVGGSSNKVGTLKPKDEPEYKPRKEGKYDIGDKVKFRIEDGGKVYKGKVIQITLSGYPIVVVEDAQELIDKGWATTDGKIILSPILYRVVEDIGDLNEQPNTSLSTGHIIDSKITVVNDPNKAKGAYESYIANIEGDGKAIVKLDVDTSVTSLDLPTIELAKAEVATYKLNQLLGFNVVPETVLRDDIITGKLTSAQQWIDNAMRPLGGRTDDIPLIDKIQIAVLDGLTGNWDRHSGNWLVTYDNHAVAIDNGLGFKFNNPYTSEATSSFWGSLDWLTSYDMGESYNSSNLKIPKTLVNSLRSLSESSTLQDTLHEANMSWTTDTIKSRATELVNYFESEGMVE